MLIVVAWNCNASADAPFISGDEPERIDSRSKAFFAVPSSDRKATVVFRRQKPKDEELWRIAGWNDNAYLSDDGEYLTVGYVGNNLLELDYTPSQAMLQFYKRGKLIRAVPLSELIRDMKSLRRSASHYSWGYYRGLVAPYRFAVDTIEGRRLIFDVATGALTKEEALKQRR
jgi:hypothetical protein